MRLPIQPPKVPPTDGVVAIRLRRDEDLPRIAAAAEDPEAHRWLDEAPGSGPPSTPLQILEIWRSGRAAPLIIADAATDEAAGLSNLQRKSDTYATVAYRVFPAWRGRGFAARALNLVAGWAFADLNLPRLVLEIDEGNAASIRVPRRCAFTRHGTTDAGDRRRSSLSATAPQTKQDAPGAGQGTGPRFQALSWDDATRPRPGEPHARPETPGARLVCRSTRSRESVSP
jgi:RimJ/RimL family protein N-acetyltransferase